MIWQALGAVAPDSLSRTRLGLHWAAQLLSAPGVSLLAAADDYSHSNLGWDSGLGLLTGRPVGSDGLRAALVFEGLELAVLDGERERTSLRLAGHSLEDALSWLGAELAPDGPALTLPSHEMPSEAVGELGVFSDAPTDAQAELGAWFANAFALIEKSVEEEPTASPVRCWPHHFDVASLITLDAGADSETARSIGVGFSPGDGSYAQPYFYVTPWPYPEAEELPSLEGGANWHRTGWTGAVLTAEAVLALPADKQERNVQRALARSITACRELLGA